MSRDAYVEKLKARLDQWNAQIDRWEAQAREAQADSKINYEQWLAGLRRQRDAAQSKLEELQSAGGDAWSALQDGAEKAFNDLRESVEKASAQFK